MLKVFDNETENGKLYISYPMVESLYDHKTDDCEAAYKCFVSGDIGEEYKNLSSTNNPIAYHKLNIDNWKSIVNAFYLRVKCLFKVKKLEFEDYRDAITPYSIYCKESALYQNNNLIFVLSAFPEFLLDYFKIDFWKSNVKRTKKKDFEDCKERQLKQ